MAQKDKNKVVVPDISDTLQLPGEDKNGEPTLDLTKPLLLPEAPAEKAAEPRQTRARAKSDHKTLDFSDPKSFDKAYSDMGHNVITRKSSEAERIYYQRLAGEVGSVKDASGTHKTDAEFFKGLTPETGLATFGPRTKTYTWNAQTALGLKQDNIPGPSTLFGLEVARHNGGVIDENVQKAAQRFEELHAKDKNASRNFAGVYLSEAKVGRQLEDAYGMADASSKLPANLRESMKPQISAPAAPGSDALKGAPYGHVAIMAFEGFDSKLRMDTNNRYVIGFGMQDRVNANGTTTPVGDLFKGKTLSLDAGYEMMKPMINHKTELCQKYLPGYDKLQQCQKDGLLSVVYNMKDTTTRGGLHSLKDSLATLEKARDGGAPASEIKKHEEHVAQCIERCYSPRQVNDKGEPYHKARRGFEAEIFRGNDIAGVTQHIADRQLETPAKADLRKALFEASKEYQPKQVVETKTHNAKNDVVLDPVAMQRSAEARAAASRVQHA